MADIRVDKIEIKIGDKTLCLSPEELRQLRDVLDATFPKKEVVYSPTIVRERYPWWPCPQWSQPSIYQNQRGENVVTFSSNTGGNYAAPAGFIPQSY